jgi:hypothetical protein
VERLSRNPPVLILVAVLALAVAGTLVLTAGMTFYQDTWGFLITRRDFSADTLFHPHNEHLVVFPALLEMVLLRVFGMSSALPEYVLLALVLVATAALLFVYMRRRVGDWLALLAAVVVLSLGPAWEVLLWPFEITFIAPILFGLAMLLALEREGRLGDLAATAFLILSIGSSGLGICFIAAAVVAVFQGRRETWIPRAYVFVVPLLLYAAWWVGWGHDAESHISLRNILASPRFVADSLAWAMQSMFGLAPTVGAAPDVSWGRALLVGAAILLGYRLWRARPRIDRGLWPILAAAMANWFLTAFNAFPGRDPSSSRYQYAGVIFVLMIVANLLTGVRPGKKAVVVLAAVTALAVGPNLVALKKGEEQLYPQSVLTQADTAAIEIASRTVDPDFQLTPPVAGTPSLINVYAGEYLEAVDEYGSPAYTESELVAAPEQGRRQADIVLSQALPLSTEIRPGGFGEGRAGAVCAAVPDGGERALDVPLSTGATRIEVAPGPPASLNLRRFSVEEFPVPTEDAPGGSVMVLRIPRDSSDRPWHLQVEAEQLVRVCSS